jgi:hypothetical protein
MNNVIIILLVGQWCGLHFTGVVTVGEVVVVWRYPVSRCELKFKI